MLCFQSGGELENDEGVATKISKMVLTAVRLVNTSEKKDAFKRLTGTCFTLAVKRKYSPLPPTPVSYTHLTLPTIRCV